MVKAGSGDRETAMEIATSRGRVRLPAYIPVSTFGPDYPLDRIIRPFLPRFTDMMLVSYLYATQMDGPPSMPCFIDSGGAALLDSSSEIRVLEDGLAGIMVRTDEGEHVFGPREVLQVQMQLADWGATLDFPIPPTMEDEAERSRRVELTVENARWMRANAGDGLRLFGSIQGWDIESYVACARQMLDIGFRDLAIGGLVRRVQDRTLVVAIVEAVRKAMGSTGLLHAFGLGEAALVRRVFDAGATSVDSSSFVRAAANGKRWDGRWCPDCPSPAERAHIALNNLKFGCYHSGSGSAASERVPENADEVRF